MGENGITISEQGKNVKVEGVFDDEDLLSDEERAAMAEDVEGEDPEDRTQAQDLEEADDAAHKAQEDADDAQKAAKIKEADEAIAAEKAKAGDESEAAGEKDQGSEAASETGSEKDADSDQAVSIPQTQPPVMMDVMSQEELDKVQSDLDAAKQKFQDGEIDYDTYFDERLRLERMIWQNDVAAKLSSDGIENQWQWEQQTFLNDASNAWIADDDVVYSAFAATVNRIMGTDEGSIMPGPELLEMAREEVAKRFSPTREADAQAAADDKAKADALKNVKQAQADKPIPETLSSVPAAEQEEGAGEFSYLDKLEGEAYERAVEALSPAQLARYENTL